MGTDGSCQALMQLFTGWKLHPHHSLGKGRVGQEEAVTAWLQLEVSWHQCSPLLFKAAGVNMGTGAALWIYSLDPVVPWVASGLKAICCYPMA